MLRFTSYLNAIFQVQAPGGGLYLKGRFNGGFFALPVWGAYIWRGLFSEFDGNEFLQVNRAGTGTIQSEDFRRYPAFRSVLFQSVRKVSFPP